MTGDDYVKRRMRKAMKDGAAIQRDLAEADDVALPPELVGRMGLAMFQARMAIAMRDPEAYDLPMDDGRGLH